MSAASRPKIHAGRAGNLAFILTVAAGFVPLLVVRPYPYTLGETLRLLVLALVYVLVGIRGVDLAERSNVLAGAYILLQSLLAAIITLLGARAGAFWIITFPLVSQSVILLPGRRYLAACVLITLGAFAVPFGLTAGWAAVLQSTLVYLSGVVFVVLFTQIAIREQSTRAEVERLAAELARANEGLRQHAIQAEELATARERNRLAREIHDSLGHYLTVINVQLEVAQTVLGQDPGRALDALRKAQSLTHEGLADVRHSIAALRRSPTEDRPLAQALSALLEECRAAGLVAEMTVTGQPQTLPPQVELTLYRAAQEGLTNTRKHARASRLDLNLDYGVSAVRLVLQDNGVGESESGQGFGLLGVRERAQLLGGQVRLETGKGKGFRLEVELPL